MTVFKEAQVEDRGSWFPYFESRIDVKTMKLVYDEPLPGAARFCIRDAVAFYKQRNVSRRRRSEFVFNQHTMAMERVSYTEDQTPEEILQERDDLRDYVITGIEGAMWEDGRQIECTRENKLKLFLNDEFDRYVAKCMATLASVGEASEKN